MPDKLMENKQMEALAPIDQCKKAIAHVLGIIAENPEVGYWMGLGSQSFALLTEAAATLWEKPVREVRERFVPLKARDTRAAFVALQEIVDRFDELNSRECDRGCGRCIRCIARRGLGEQVRS